MQSRSANFGFRNSGIKHLMVTICFTLLLALFPSGCTDGDVGPGGPRGLKGEPGVAGDTGSGGDDGAPGLQGDAGAQGADGVDGTSCHANAEEGGIQITCANGTSLFLPHGQPGNSGTNGTDGTSCYAEEADGGFWINCANRSSTFIQQGSHGANGSTGLSEPTTLLPSNGTNGDNGTACSSIASDGGISIQCGDNNTAPIFHGINGEMGTSCHATDADGGVIVACGEDNLVYIQDGRDGQNGINGIVGQSGDAGTDGHRCSSQETDGGVQVICTDGSNARVRDGNDGQNGNAGIDGQNGDAGADGDRCSAQEIDAGLQVNCTDGTTAFVRDGQDGQNGQDGQDGLPGANGEGCLVSSAANGVTITCATGSETVHHGANCTITSGESALEVSCPDHDGNTTNASLVHAAYVEPYGVSLVTNIGNLSKNNALFILFDAPASGIFDYGSIFQGDQGNGSVNFSLEMAVFEQVGSNWQMLEGSEMIVIPTEDTHGFDHQRYIRSGFNANLTAGTSYMFVIRNAGPSNAWRYDYHAVTNSSAPHVAWTKSVSTSLDTYTTTLSSLSGTRNIPWFRLTQ